MELPQAWSEEKHEHMPNYMVLKHEVYGWVTIDLEKRIFSLGMGQPRTWRPSMAYSGRGWKERIAADAMAHLEGLWNAA